MANQLSGQSGPSPTTHSKHIRRGRFARLRGGADQFSAFLAAQATRLASTPTVIYSKLKKYTADRVKQATNISQLP